MISLEKLKLRYGEQVLFNEATALIGTRDRIGLVGPNGAGKSSLLKIINDLEEYDGGRIEKASFVSIGYLPQDGLTAKGRSLYKEAESAFENILDIQKRLQDASKELETLDAESPEYTELLELCGELEHRLDELDAHKLKAKVEKVLLGLGFSMSDMERDCGEFSGGWQMRIALARLLLREPSLLLLDEPTNHLDLDSLRWVENYLKNYDGAFMLVSHDRAFLDSICNRVFAISHAKIESYTGNFTRYEKQSAERKEQLLKAQKTQQKQIAKTEEFIERFRAKATKASQVQSRIKHLDKIQRIEIEEDKSGIAFNFPAAERSGNTVLKVENLNKSYDDNHVLKSVNLEIIREERVAIVGPNGAGKSTLNRILAGTESFQSGTRTLGHNVKLSFFAQHQADELDPDKTVLEIASESVHPDLTRRVRDILGSFLFRGDAVDKKVKVLSGGEKNRLALSKMLLQPSNCLIFDEPTNHLDMQSKEVLKEALKAYNGTYLIVSHDRDFLDSIVNRVLEVTHTGIRNFVGNLSDYIRKTDEERSFTQASKSQNASNSISNLDNPKLRRQKEAERRKQLAPLKKRCEELENQIIETEEQIETIETEMNDENFYKQGKETQERMSFYEKLKVDLETMTEEWERVGEELLEKESQA